MSQPRRRLRNSFVCSFCKRRKVRCDKANPCSLCVKYANAVCEYPKVLAKAVPRKERADYGEAVMTLDSPTGSTLTRAPSTSTLGSILSSASTFAPDGVHLELELLKHKIKLLELSVLLKQTEHPGYNSPVWCASSLDDLLFLLGYNPYVGDTQTYLFHQLYVPYVSTGKRGARYHGPLSWIALVKMDLAASQMFAYKLRAAMKKRMVLLLDKNSLRPAEHVFGKRLQTEACEELYGGDVPLKNEESAELSKKVNERARVVGLTLCEDDIAAELNILGKIKLVLPTRKVLWMLVDRFFERVYPFFPFLDQFDFEERLVSIFGSDRLHVKVDKLNVSAKMDLIYIALLLLVLRFAYFTLFSNNEAQNEANLKTTDPSPRAQEIKFLLSNPIDIDAVDVAQMCLSQFGYLRFCNLPLLQLHLYLKLYYNFAPENGDSPEDTNSQSYTALLVNMAISLGLHREPDNIFKDNLRDEKTNNLCRKIWYYLLVMDIQDGMSNGIHLNTRRSLFDTLPPFYKPGCENVRNTEVEIEAINCLLKIDMCYDQIAGVIALIANVSSPVKMKDLCTTLTSLEENFIKNMTPYYLEANGQLAPLTVQETLATKIYFQVNFFMASICMHLFNYYERNDNLDLAYYYLKKVIAVSVHNMMPFYDYFVEKSAIWFQFTSDLAVTPAFQNLVHKCIIVIHCVMLRLRFSILKYENSSPVMQDEESRRRYELLRETYDLCHQCMMTFIETMTKLSSRYYYSWRCMKAQESIRVASEGTDYFTNFCKGKEAYMKFSNPMLEDLNSILASALDRVKNNKVKNEQNYTTFTDELFRGSTPTYATPMSMNNKDNPANGVIEDIDSLWMQMLSQKPLIIKSGMYSRTPPTIDIDLGMGVFDNYIPSYEGNIAIESNVASTSLFENLFDANQ